MFSIPYGDFWKDRSLPFFRPLLRSPQLHPTTPYLHLAHPSRLFGPGAHAFPASHALHMPFLCPTMPFFLPSLSLTLLSPPPAPDLRQDQAPSVPNPFDSSYLLVTCPHPTSPFPRPQEGVSPLEPGTPTPDHQGSCESAFKKLTSKRINAPLQLRIVQRDQLQ